MVRTYTRREMVRATGLASLAIGALLSIPAIGFVLSPLFQKKARPSWIGVGRPGDIDGVKVGEPTPFTVAMPIREGPPADPVPRIVYIVKRDTGELLTLSNICSHMQCDVHWDPALGQFLCPCHGGLYDMSGTQVGGPPPSPLPRWLHRTRRDAQGRTIVEVSNQLDENI